MKLSEIKKNPRNPRLIKDEKFSRLVKSLQEFPRMMALRPIVIDSEGSVLGGNMRYEALKALGMKEIPDDWVKRADELTEEQKQEFIISAPYPVIIPERFIALYTDESEVCFEPFAGSGTTIVAAHQTKRVCYAMEIEPRYCAVTLERMTALGLTPALVSNETETKADAV